MRLLPRRYTRVVLVGALLAVVAMSGFVFAAPSDPLTQICSDQPSVRPGIGIGSVRLGSSFVDAVRRLGPPTSMGANRNREASSGDPGWHAIVRPEEGAIGRAQAGFGPLNRYLYVHATNDAIDAVQVLAIDCRDDSGVGLGTPWPTVVAHYGEQYSTWRGRSAISVVYNSLGLQLLVAPTTSDSGTVVGFEVFAPHRYCDAFGPTACAKYTPPLR